MTQTITCYSAKSIDELPELWDGFARLVRAGLGITAFGAQGTGAVVVGDERLPLDPDHLVRVDAGIGRVLTSGPDGLRVLCIGAVPGRAYEPPPWTTAAAGGH
jgi:hypothetical protein